MNRENPKIITLVQARTTSSRLPGKVLQEILGKPMLVHVVERAQRATTCEQVVVATTSDDSDVPIVDLCKRMGYACFRGSLHDVLDRFYQAAKLYQANVVVRLTADCPLIDPQVIDLTVRAFQGLEKPPAYRTSLNANIADAMLFDFAANRLPPPWSRTYPIGLDTEVVSFAALERAWQEAGEKYQREHVLPYLYDDIGVNFDQPSRFHVLVVDWKHDFGAMRWTVDTPQDLALVRRVFEAFGHNRFSWLEVIKLFQSHPELAEMNADVVHKTTFDVDPRAQ
jgi:spore coat polysaccharide biosynthesis protein SpsF